MDRCQHNEFVGCNMKDCDNCEVYKVYKQGRADVINEIYAFAMNGDYDLLIEWLKDNIQEVQMSEISREDRINEFANWLVKQGILGNRCIADGEITDYGKVYAKKYKEQLKGPKEPTPRYNSYYGWCGY